MALVALGLTLPAAAQSGTAKVRVVHASPDAPAVDIFVDGQSAMTNVAFFTASDYMDLPAGAHKVAVAPAGAGEAAAVISADVTLEANKAYTIAAVGPLASIKAQIYNDNLAAPAAGKAHVRVIHASPDAPAVAVKVANGPTLIPSLAFPNASDYLPVDATTYNIQVTPANASDVVLDLPNTTLTAGTIYDVFAVGNLANIKAEVKTFTPAASGSSSGAAAPGTLPNTGAGDSLSLALIGLGVLALAGGFLLRRRTA
jgi:LPXTG-motif cell wall-anchored protein